MNIQNVKIFTNNKSTRLFEGFTLQKGFMFGFINNEIPFVCNGAIFSKYINVYFLNHTNEWKPRKIFNSDPFYKKLVQMAEKNKSRVPKEYANSLQLEQMHINNLRANGLDTKLFSTNGAILKKDAKISNSNKNITNSITANNYLQSRSIATRVAI